MDVGGAERFTYNLALSMSETGIKVFILSGGGIFVDNLTDGNIVPINCCFAKSSSLYNLIKLRRVLKDLIAFYNFDLIHCQHRIFVPIVKSLHCESKIIYTANNLFMDIFQKVLTPDIAVAPSPIIEYNLRNSLNIPQSRILRINYGVRVNADLTVKSKVGISTIGYAGRLIKKKGVFRLLKIFKNISRQYPSLKLRIVGDGPLKSEINRYLNNNRLINNVRLIHKTTDTERIYENIDVLVLPTQLNEGLPVSILEAAGKGILVIASRTGAIMDVIENNKTGYLIKNFDSDLESVLVRLINNPESISNIIVAAHKKVLEHFNLRDMTSAYKQLYASLCSD